MNAGIAGFHGVKKVRGENDISHFNHCSWGAYWD